jgi:decaprenylphospho-beta-D-ribofuranose 2-oxidase
MANAAHRERRSLSGWGRTAPSVADVARPTSVGAIAELLTAPAPRGVIARGLGRSYGDVAQNGGGMVVDLTGLDSILDFNTSAGTVTVAGGCSLAAIIELVAPVGWFLPVTPGTRFVTVGGAIACDVHGKNHHRDGSFGSHVAALTLLTASGDLRTLSPEETPREFWATVGGLGLTGFVVEATLKLLPAESTAIRVDTERTADLDATFEKLRATDQSYRYSVAWLDCATRGRLGRGIVIQGDHAAAGEADTPSALPSQHPRISAPGWLSLAPVLRSPLIGLLNDVNFRRARPGTGRIEAIEPFFYPLDALGDWNRVYGRGGFLQYQFAVPLDREDVVHSALGLLYDAGLRSTLAVLKRFGPESQAPLSFPFPGWTLALDIALPAPAAARTLSSLDDLVAEAGGRVYLAKDSRLRRELVEVMNPRLPEWQAVRRELDPDGLFQHDLGRRLGLTGSSS